MMIESKGGVNLAVNEAVANLTMFSKECAVDVEEMIIKRDEANRDVREKTKEIQDQDKNLRE